MAINASKSVVLKMDKEAYIIPQSIYNRLPHLCNIMITCFKQEDNVLGLLFLSNKRSDKDKTIKAFTKKDEQLYEWIKGIIVSMTQTYMQKSKFSKEIRNLYSIFPCISFLGKNIPIHEFLVEAEEMIKRKIKCSIVRICYIEFKELYDFELEEEISRKNLFTLDNVDKLVYNEDKKCVKVDPCGIVREALRTDRSMYTTSG